MPTPPHILVANEPAAYRDMLASELPRLRPHLTVLQVEPADLDSVVTRIHPRLVICSRLTHAIRQHATALIVLYPHGTNRAILDIDGEQQVLPNPELTELLAAIDNAFDPTRRPYRLPTRE